MAKMFYTMDETKAALSMSEDDIKQLAKDGRLREFRDGPRLMFKADQVDLLKVELSGSDQVNLGPSDSGAPIGLADSRGSGAGISLSDVDAPAKKEDTSLAADLGLSGSMGGVPSPGRANPLSGSGSGLSSAQASKGGINVFGSDEVEHADPMAQTAITSGIQDQVNLEGVGSGSGLLDLTRESDDTSLGAELLDEIAPGTGKRSSVGHMAETGMGIDSIAETSGQRSGFVSDEPVTVEAADPMAAAFGGLSLGGVAALMVGILVLIATITNSNPSVDSRPAFIRSLGDGGHGLGFIVIIGLVVSVVFFVAGMLLGKMSKR